MKATITLFLLTASAVQATIPLSSVKLATSLSIAPSKFIVEVSAPSQIPTKRSVHETLYDSLNKRGILFSVGKEFNDPLFYGSVLTLSNPSDIAKLQSTAGIVAVRAVTLFKRPTPVLVHPVTDAKDPKIPVDTESTHIMTGVNKLHAEGLLGKGVKIGIIDTGTDYTNPYLGGGFGKGFKVYTGYDFVGDAYNGTAASVPVPDNDPLDQCEGHGTHVAGIIGANPGNPFNISGVAYKALIASYRIFGCTGGVSDDIIVEALLRGNKDGVDILTLSLGGADGWTESTSSVVASKIARSGKVVTIAAGNDGQYGSWYTSSPGNGIDVISVASVNNLGIPLQNATVSGVTPAHAPIPYYQALPFNETGPFPIYATSNSSAVVGDACSALPAGTPDLSPYLVIIRRGGCTFVEKLTNAAAKGAKRFFIYNNVPGLQGISVGNFSAVLISADDGAYLVSQFAAGKTGLRISFPQTGASFNYADPLGGLVSDFTSYGPTNDMNFKPAVGAPGGNILSTYPVKLGTFAVLSGTSMATPFMAGSAALLIEAKGLSKAKDTALGARDVFETNAAYIPSSKTDGDPLQTVTQQGAGLVNVYQAVKSFTRISPGSLQLNDTAHFKGAQSFTVKNAGGSTKKYKITHVPAGTATTIVAGTIFAADGPVPLTTQYATVTTSPSSFTLGPGQSVRVSASFTPPKGVDATTYPVYSGFLQVTSGSEVQHVSYLGVAASLRNKQVIDNTNVTFGIPLPSFLDSTGNPQENVTTYTFKGDDFPSILYRLAFGTPSLQADIVESNIQFNATYSKRSVDTTSVLKRDFFGFPYPIVSGGLAGARSGSGSYAKVKVCGNLFSLPYQPRSSDAATAEDNGFSTFALQTPQFGNGTTIPNGSFRVLIRGLRVTADPKNEDSYESWLSPVFNINA